MKKTVVLGATPNPDRYAYMAVERLVKHGHEAVPVGIRKGTIQGIEIQQAPYATEQVDTVTLYVNPEVQKQYYDYVLGLHPKRIIFNPGTENPEFEKMAEEKGIEVQEACTLVMLGNGLF
ncbi:MAG: CoA-binding protein [Cytophagales bacterium]|nr:CoA-binding protein [Cytophagales bacterium]